LRPGLSAPGAEKGKKQSKKNEVAAMSSLISNTKEFNLNYEDNLRGKIKSHFIRPVARHNWLLRPVARCNGGH